MKSGSILSAVFLIGSAGCSSGGDAGGGGGSAEQIASRYCAKLAECANASLVFVYGDESTCRARNVLGVQPGLAVSNGNAAACGAAYASETCDEFLSRKTSPPAACRFTGSGVNGSACGTDWQCSSGFCSFSGTCGVCATAPGPGDACVGYRCGGGLSCTSAGRCIVPGGAGATCGANDCDRAFSCVGGKCAANVGAGQPCATDGTKPDCSLGYYCGPSKVCTALKFAALGESCGAVGSDYVFCKGAFCKYPTSGGAVGTCAAYAKDGDPCGVDASCQSPARCVSGSCKLENPTTCK